ncbi:MAG: hypothetical protein KJ630_24290 [Proteobacteria bacterium]|nr:hypothetical protein [Pseudomonadota bacterium]
MIFQFCPVLDSSDIPYWLANCGRKGAEILIRLMRKTGLKATLPPELMFLDSFYKPQTLSIAKLQESSFIDPMPEETIFSRLPDMVAYYLNRWSNENLITINDKTISKETTATHAFASDPESLIDSVHSQGIGPFPDIQSK